MIPKSMKVIVMKNILLIGLFTTLLAVCFGQTMNEMVVVKQAERRAEQIISQEHMDKSGRLCAGLEIITDLTGLGFDSNVGIVSFDYKPGRYIVYVSPRERVLRVHKSGYRQLDVVLSNYGIYGIESGEVYRLEITAKDKKRGIENVNIVVNTDPNSATIYLNDKKVDNPRQISAPIGKNDIRIEFDGYKPIIEEIDVSEQNTFFEYQLELSMDVPVTIETEPAGATIYLSDVECGITPNTFFYQAGEYRLKITLRNYATIEEVIEIKEPQTIKKYKLEDIRGILTIKTGSNSKIYINDEYYPQGVNRVKIAPQLVQIKITTPKSEDINRSIVIKEKENYELELYPVLDTGTIGVNVVPLNAQVELLGDAGERFSSKGSQTFREVPIGTYQLEIKSDGHKTHRESFAVKKDDVIRKQIALEEGADVPEKMVYVKGGTFKMGRTKGSGEDRELPVHNVTLDSFYISKYLVTQKEYKEIMGANPASGYGVGDNYPVYYVSWYSAIKFCNLLSMKEGLTPVYSISGSTNPANWGSVPTSSNSTWNKAVCNWNANGYRLPTEAEWEYAARGGSNTPDYFYSGSDNIGNVAWYEGNNSPRGTKPVGGKKPNGLGIYDMSGNLWEWCWDWYDSYSSSPSNNPTGPSSGSSRLLRGGFWYINAVFCRVAYRSYINPYYSDNGVGFRLCRAIP